MKMKNVLDRRDRINEHSTEMDLFIYPFLLNAVSGLKKWIL